VDDPQHVARLACCFWAGHTRRGRSGAVHAALRPWCGSQPTQVAANGRPWTFLCSSARRHCRLVVTVSGPRSESQQSGLPASTCQQQQYDECARARSRSRASLRLAVTRAPRAWACDSNTRRSHAPVRASESPQTRSHCAADFSGWAEYFWVVNGRRPYDQLQPSGLSAVSAP